MKFVALKLEGAWLLELDRHQDERGYFGRTWCAEELGRQGLIASLAQCSTSFNRSRGTVRGMHFQQHPHEETKIVRCTRGSIFDVLVDLRPASQTFRQWQGFELNEDNGRSLYIPAGFAHGFQALADSTEVLYLIDRPFVPSAARGIRYDDPAISVRWPEPVTLISTRDQQFEDYSG